MPGARVASKGPRADERGAAQSLTQIPASVGQILGAAVVGSIAASLGNGPEGYREAFLFVGFIMAVMYLFGFGLKSQAAERETVARVKASS